MLIEILIPNAPELHCGLQRLDYDLGDRYTLTPNIIEDIKFQKGTIVKLKPIKSSKSEN
jgi:hypothetical protein